jgi:signal peptidase II
MRLSGIRIFVHCLIVAAAVFAADQFTKYLVTKYIPVGGTVPDEASYVKLFHTLNDGVAFSMLQGYRVPLIVMQSILVAVIVAVMIFCYRRLGNARRPLVVMTAFSLMLGGGLGNLYDRISTGMVTDFVSIGKFAVFNTADACLTTGCGLLILYVLRYAGGGSGSGVGVGSDADVGADLGSGLDADVSEDPDSDLDVGSDASEDSDSGSDAGAGLDSDAGSDGQEWEWREP